MQGMKSPARQKRELARPFGGHNSFFPFLSFPFLSFPCEQRRRPSRLVPFHLNCTCTCTSAAASSKQPLNTHSLNQHNPTHLTDLCFAVPTRLEWNGMGFPIERSIMIDSLLVMCIKSRMQGRSTCGCEHDLACLCLNQKARSPLDPCASQHKALSGNSVKSIHLSIPPACHAWKLNTNPLDRQMDR